MRSAALERAWRPLQALPRPAPWSCWPGTACEVARDQSRAAVTCVHQEAEELIAAREWLSAQLRYIDEAMIANMGRRARRLEEQEQRSPPSRHAALSPTRSRSPTRAASAPGRVWLRVDAPGRVRPGLDRRICRGRTLPRSDRTLGQALRSIRSHSGARVHSSRTCRLLLAWRRVLRLRSLCRSSLRGCCPTCSATPC